MRKWTTIAAIVVSLGIVDLAGRAADRISVNVDPRANFSTFKTFALGKSAINSPRPELDNRLFVKMLNDAIREALTAKGLKEDASRPDLVATFQLSGEDLTTTERGNYRGAGPRPVRKTEGTLVIDLTRPGDQAPVWRGTYVDEESTGSRLVEKLPEDARKLIGRLATGGR